MDIHHLEVSNVTVQDIIKNEVYDIVSYKITNNYRKLEVERCDGHIDSITYTDHNRKVCEYQMRENLMSARKKYDSFVHEQKQYEKDMIVLGIAACGIYYFSFEHFIFCSIPGVWLGHHAHRLGEYKKIEETLKSMQWVADEQSKINAVLKDRKFFFEMEPTSKKSILENGHQYTLNNYDEITPKDRSKIYQKAIMEIGK